jgi:23S rRNA (uracil1939-C5)-methyltransferase
MYNIKKNDTVELVITDINNLGAGVSHLEDGRVVFVRGAVTGDKIKAKIIKVNSNFAVARLEDMIESSIYRDNQIFCNASESCGGCVYRHITYEHEKEIKKSYVKHAFIKAGLPEVVINDVHSIELKITLILNNPLSPQFINILFKRMSVMVHIHAMRQADISIKR